MIIIVCGNHIKRRIESLWVPCLDYIPPSMEEEAMPQQIMFYVCVGVLRMCYMGTKGRTSNRHTLILLFFASFLPTSGTNAMYANHVSAYYEGLISI